MHRATVLGRTPSRTTHAAKGPLPFGATTHFGSPPLARRRHHLKHRGHRTAAFGSTLSHHFLSDDLPRRGSDCCVWADLAVALVVLGLFAVLVYAHTLLPPTYP